jgi:hypothetical protein
VASLDGAPLENLTVTGILSGNAISGNVFSFSDTWRFNYNEALSRLEIEYHDGNSWQAKAVLAQL